MIDLYDVLGVGLDADTDEIRKAFRDKSRQVHPDKVNASSGDNVLEGGGGRSREDLFNEVRHANDVLKEPSRRKIYDTFGFDPGEQLPEMEVWNLGLQMLLNPSATFTLKTVVSRIILWLVTIDWIRYSLITLGVVFGALYGMNKNLRGIEIRSPDMVPVLLNVGILNILVVLSWLWPLLAETVGVLYLLSEFVGFQVFIDNRKLGIGTAVGILVFEWLAQNWWWWIVGFEVGIVIFLLIALTVSVGLMRLWIDQVQGTKGEKLKESRLALRKERKKNADEIAAKKRKLQARS